MEISNSWHSYPKVYNLGHALLSSLLGEQNVLVQEKVDGSQFSFGRFGSELRVRSRGTVMEVEEPEKMFAKAVKWVKENAERLSDGATYRGEYLMAPKHNTLAYDRHPVNHIILFDVTVGEECYLPPFELASEAIRLGLEVVPQLYYGPGKDLTHEMIKEFMDRVSCLGGQKLEGIVIKNYFEFGPDKKVLMGKHVSEHFKETHKTDWKGRNPGKGDIIASLGETLRTTARWDKAIQHLKERGALQNAPQDIPNLLKEVKADVLAECGDLIREELFNYGWPHIQRIITRGLPEWYKEQLAASQFQIPKEQC